MVVQSHNICSDCFGLIVLIPLPEGQAEILNDDEILAPIALFSLTCQVASDYQFSSDTSSPSGRFYIPVFTQPSDSMIRQVMGHCL